MIPILIGLNTQFQGDLSRRPFRAVHARGSAAPATATSDSEAMKVSQSLAQLAFVSPACRRQTFKGENGRWLG